MIPIGDEVPTRRFPLVNWLIIITNLIVFLYELQLGQSGLQHLAQEWAVVPHRFVSAVSTHDVETVFSAMFMHGSWLHLIGNMWALCIFGDNIEDRMGHVKYAMFYLVCGIAATLTQIYFTPGATVPSLGASGAIAGVMGAYMVFYPTARVRTWFGLIFIFMMPAWFVIGEWFVVQLINGSTTLLARDSSTAGIAWFAHVGGFIAGMILAHVFEDRDLERPLQVQHRAFERIS